jgi:hypothetical protein
METITNVVVWNANRSQILSRKYFEGNLTINSDDHKINNDDYVTVNCLPSVFFEDVTDWEYVDES